MFFAFQQTAPDSAVPAWMFVVAIVAIGLLFLGFLIQLIIRHVAKGRELAHLERMKALELGLPTGPSAGEKCQARYLHNVFWISFWIGAVVPMAATSAAGTVITRAEFQDLGIILAIWICAAVISVASVVCATTLMISSRSWSSRGGKETSANGATGQRNGK